MLYLSEDFILHLLHLPGIRSLCQPCGGSGSLIIQESPLFPGRTPASLKGEGPGQGAHQLTLGTQQPSSSLDTALECAKVLPAEAEGAARTPLHRGPQQGPLFGRETKNPRACALGWTRARNSCRLPGGQAAAPQAWR